MRLEDVTTQSPRIGISYVVDPAANACIQFGKGYFLLLIEVDVVLQSPGEVNRVTPLQPAVRRIDHKTEPGNPAVCWHDLRFAFMNGQAQALQSFDNSLFPLPELPFAVAEKCHIIDVS